MPSTPPAAFLVALAALFVASCARPVVRLAVPVPPAGVARSSGEQGALDALRRATETNAAYPKKLNDRRLATYHAALKPTPGLDDAAYQQAAVDALIAVGSANATYRQRLEDKK